MPTAEKVGGGVGGPAVSGVVRAHQRPPNALASAPSAQDGPLCPRPPICGGFGAGAAARLATTSLRVVVSSNSCSALPAAPPAFCARELVRPEGRPTADSADCLLCRVGQRRPAIRGRSTGAGINHAPGFHRFGVRNRSVHPPSPSINCGLAVAGGGMLMHSLRKPRGSSFRGARAHRRIVGGPDAPA